MGVGDTEVPTEAEALCHLQILCTSQNCALEKRADLAERGWHCSSLPSDGSWRARLIWDRCRMWRNMKEEGKALQGWKRHPVRQGIGVI